MNLIGSKYKPIEKLFGNPFARPQRKIGASPDELIFFGDLKRETVELTLIEYNDEELTERSASTIEDCGDLHNATKTSWLNINGLHDAKIIKNIGEKLGIESFVMADIVDTDLRPKVQDFENYIFISCKMLMYDKEKKFIDIEHISLILMDNLLLSFQEKEGDVFEPIRQRLRDHKKRIRTWGADYLAFALLDIVIDNYTYVLGAVGDKIEKLELELLDNPDDKLLPRINTYKKEVNYLRRSIKPSLEMVNILSKTDTPLIKKRTGPFYKELVYNCQMASDITDSYSEMLNDQLNFYHTTMSTKLNEIMKFLTIFSVIFIPLTFIAGIYGTNFKYIPELDYHYGYFVMMGAMFVVALIMVIYFRRKKWM